MKLIATLSSDLILKSAMVRRKFQRVLLNNLRQAFKREGIEYTLDLDLGHIFVTSPSDKALEIVKRTFGIDSISIIEKTCESDFEIICQTACELYRDFTKQGSYSIKTKRKGSHNFTSENINRKIGGMLSTEENHVNIKNADHPIFIYIKDEVTYFHSKKIQAEGGLPLGCGGKALCLVSGGFDSILASWIIQKRGVRVDYLFCNMGGKAYERSTLEVTKELFDLWGNGGESKFYSIDFNPLIKELKEKVKPAFNQVVLKRLFCKAADNICFRGKYDAIITGEALGQVSSQTLKNLRAIENSVQHPILRPLVGFNKNEIVAKCQHIGTYGLSAKISEFCQITKEKPVTATSAFFLNEQFEKIDPEVIEKSFQAFKKISLNQEKSVLLENEDYFLTDEIPKEAIILDCRQESAFKQNSYPEAKWISPHQFEKKGQFSKDKTYLLFCEHSTQSFLFAEELQKEGYTAYGLRGGEKAFQKLSTRTPR